MRQLNLFCRVMGALGLLVLLVACPSGGTPTLLGSLNVAVEGLPNGTNASIIVNGPNGYLQAVSSTTTLTGLTPGTYTVTADDVESNADIYTPSVSGSPATVAAGATASASVSYTLQAPESEQGSLGVTIAGLPGGAQASVTVSGPDGFSQALTASATLIELTPGNYTVSASDVTHEGVVYGATVTGSPATVTAGSTASASVTYSVTDASPGSLNLTVSGLPDNTDADVTVGGPEDFNQTVSATTTLSDLTPGEYTVTAADVTVDGDVYAAIVTGSPATVPAGGSASVSVSYTFLDPTTVGTLEVTVSGLPDGVEANVSVNGPGFETTLTESATLAGLTPGNYTVTAETVSQNSATFVAVVEGSPALVLPEETASVTVTYTQFAEPDNDAASEPGLHVNFRGPTSPAVWIDRALFNRTDPVRARAIQYRKEVSNPGNQRDWVTFNLLGNSSGSQGIRLTLDCGDDDAPIRAVLRSSTGSMIRTINCGQSLRPSLPAPGDYLIEVGQSVNNPNLFYSTYQLTVEQTCPPSGCNFQPFE